MPYILPDLRADFDSVIAGLNPKTVGDLNYIVTRIVLQYMQKNTKSNYEAWNGAIGMLECCKLEMYRRAVSPYEDTKIKANGDCY